MKKQLSFRISSALKDIIGRDLVKDDFVAIFELVKNSYDALASKVEIVFTDIDSPNAKISIKDNGKGMGYLDIKNKWLFVAYSAKNEKTEDSDYKDRIYAGHKGIGRFSCDRLGKQLKLITVKKGESEKCHILNIDWELFEENIREEFNEVKSTYNSIQNQNSSFKKGTIIEITKLRSNWDRQKLLKLKESLAKLISPTSDINERKFSVTIHAEEEVQNDAKQSEYSKIVNGEIKNFIFETLGLKTTQIISSISPDGQTITTSLLDGGTFIYRVSEKNTFKKLSNIKIQLFYLNMSAKLVFKKKMGVSTVNYGSVSLYKNGFRVYPFGEPGEDALGLDKRKSQGYRRHLGTRDLIGQIGVFGEKNDLRETSSRGDGLIKTTTYNNLIEYFFEKVLKRLERYVIDVQEWGLSIEGDFNSTEKNVFYDKVLTNLIKITSDDKIVDLEYNEDIKNIIENIQSDSALVIVSNLKKIARESNNEKLEKIAISVEQKFRNITSLIKEAEVKEDIESNKLKVFEDQLEQVVSENLFLKSLQTEDFSEILSLMHHIGIYAGTIDNYLKGLYGKVSKKQVITNEEIADIVKIISFELEKITSISKFAIKANFKLVTEFLKTNIDDYLREYILNVINAVKGSKMAITFKNTNSTPYIKEIRPIEINIIVDNLIDNAKKAGAKHVEVWLRRNSSYKFQIVISDDGHGIPDENLPYLFNFGFTTTSGSGLGLYHVSQIVKRINGDIGVKSQITKGTIFTITLN